MSPRPWCKAVLAALTCALLGAAPATGQEAPPAPLPKAPIPYAKINPPSRKLPARPAPAPAPSPEQEAAPLAPTFTPQTSATPLSPAELEAFVDGFVREAMDDDHVAGAAVSVVQNGQVVLKKGYGLAGVSPARPVDPDRTLFRIGSISKTFTWIAVMQEIEAGRMRLDGPVNLYLPQKAQVRDEGYDKAVTLRHLMTHTPGFEDRVLGHLFERDYGRVRPLLTYLRQERPSRVREPGVLPAYSNYGAALAGAAAANVTGLPFETLMERRIIGPAGLARTTFREPHPARKGLPAPMPEALAGDLADGLRWTPLGYRKRDFEYIGHIAPAGAASSTAGDMARYMTLLLDGGTIDGRTVFSPKVAGWMRTSLYRPAKGAAGWNHGFQEVALPGGRRGFGHAGATLSFHANLIVVPELGLGVFVAANTDTGYDLAANLPEAIVGRFYTPPSPLPPQGMGAKDRKGQVYAGTYLTNRRAYGGLEGFVSALNGFSKVAVTPEGYLSTTDPSGVRRWAPTQTPGLFRQVNGAGALAFQMRDGKAVRFFPPSGGAAFERRGLVGSPELLAVLAALTAVAACATLIGLAVRDRRDFRETQLQSRASLLQTTQAVLWLLTLGGFAVWVAGTGDVANVLYEWPGLWLVLASACALVAALLTAATVAMAPMVWRGGRRLDSWTLGRKIRFSMTAAIFTAFSAVLAFWGALFPWSG